MQGQRLQTVVGEVRKLWWIPLLQGILALVVGFLLFGQPVRTLLVLMTWLGLYWLIDGLVVLLDALLGKPHPGRLWQFLYGVLGLLAGLVALMHPLLSGTFTSTFVATIFAVSLIVNGLISAFALPVVSPLTGQRSWGSLLLSLLYVIGGVVLLLHPGLTALSLLSLFAVWALVVGVSQIITAFQIKNLLRA